MTRREWAVWFAWVIASAAPLAAVAYAESRSYHKKRPFALLGRRP